MLRTCYHTCPTCGANLDPGEQCDCRQRKGDDKAVKTDSAYRNDDFHRYRHNLRLREAPKTPA